MTATYARAAHVYQQSFRNVSDETMPAFACFQLQKQLTRAAWSYDGQRVWGAHKPDGTGAANQEPYEFAFNGPQAVPPGGTGKCTQEWPAVAVHDCEEEEFFPSTPGVLASDALPACQCGPQSNSWWLSRNGYAFRAIGTETPLLVSSSSGRPSPFQGTRYTPIVVVPNFTGRTPAYYNYMRGSAHTIAADAPILQEYQIDVCDWTATAIQVVDGGLVCRVPGVYHYGFSGTVSSQSATSGASLILELRKHERTAETWENTGGFAWAARLQVYLSDGSYGEMATAENVATSGMLTVSEPDTLLRVHNASQHPISVGYFSFWLRLAALGSAVS